MKCKKKRIKLKTILKIKNIYIKKELLFFWNIFINITKIDYLFHQFNKQFLFFNLYSLIYLLFDINLSNFRKNELQIFLYFLY